MRFQPGISFSGLKTLGTSAVVAESFGRIFFRNAVAIALAVVPCPGVSRSFKVGEMLELDLKIGRIKNLTRNLHPQGKPLPQEMFDVLNNGAIIPLLKKCLGKVDQGLEDPIMRK